MSQIILNVLLVTCGLFMLYFGAEWLVRGSIHISNKFNVSQLMIGLTIVAFGTSSPELAVSLSAAVNNSSDVALGNVVGSNIANVGLILGAAAMIRPILVSKSITKKEIPIMLGVSFLLLAIASDGKIDRLEGILLIIGIGAFTIFSYKSSKTESNVTESGATVEQKSIKKSVLLVAIGLIILTVGAFLTVENSVAIAKTIGISELIIGLTLVAVGTSLPELVTSVVAALRGHSDLSVGNILGSNVFNILAIVGLSSTVATINASSEIFLDMIVMILFAFVALPIMRSGFAISRKEGLVLFTGYIAYVTYLILA